MTPTNSNGFVVVLGALFVLGVVVLAWQVIVGYETQQTSVWFLGTGLLVGIAVFVGAAVARMPMKTLGLRVVWTSAVIALIPVLLPKLIFLMFYFGSMPVNRAARDAITSQAQGMVLLGLFFPIVIRGGVLALRR